MRLGDFLPADRNMLFLFKKLDNGESPNKEEDQLTLVMLCPVLSTHDSKSASWSWFGTSYTNLR
jgi:hypothetical protein